MIPVRQGMIYITDTDDTVNTARCKETVIAYMHEDIGVLVIPGALRESHPTISRRERRICYQTDVLKHCTSFI